MKLRINPKEWEDTKAANPGDFTPLPAGGYVCRIVKAEFTTSKQGNDMLVFNIDIAEGDFAGYFKSTVDRFNQTNWPNAAVYRQLVWGSDKKVAPFFKGLIRIVEACNHGFVAFNNELIDEAAFAGKMCGFIFCDEEYVKQDGSVAVRTVVRTPKLIADIRDGNFKVPPLKKVDASKAAPSQRKSSYAQPPDGDPPQAQIHGNDFIGAPIYLEDPPFDL